MKKINRKGMSNSMAVILLFVGIIFAGAVGYSISQLKPAAALPTVTYDGELQDGGIPEDASGTDLQVEVAYAESDNNASMVMNTTSRINENTSTGTEYWSYMFKIDGPVKSLDIDADFDPDAELTATAKDNYDLKRVYILEDSSDLNVMDDDLALYDCVVDNDDEEFSCDIPIFPKGQYVVVLEMRIVGPTVGDLAATFYKIDHDFSGGDRDTLVVYIENQDA